MTQNDLNRAIARATGETVTEIGRRGFQPLTWESLAASADERASSHGDMPQAHRVKSPPCEPVAV